jgi:RDD family
VLPLTAPTNGDYAAAAVLTVSVLVIVGYPTVFETLSRGKTLGKLALGLRVVGDDGSPVRFRQALVRALAGAIEVWVLTPVALICSIASDRGKRVGDFFAGTYVVQERTPARRALPAYLAVVPPQLAGWAQSLQVAGLSEQTAEAAGSYLRRYGELSPGARDTLGLQLASTVATQVTPLPPAGTPPVAYLAAVLAVRRQRDQASFGGWVAPAATGQAPQPMAQPFPPGFASPPQLATQPPDAASPLRQHQPPAEPATGFVPPA